MRKSTRRALSAAGRKGAAKRWGRKKAEPTKTTRIYVADAPRLAEVAGKSPDAIRKLLDERDAK